MKEKKKDEPARKVFTSGVGKFINPKLKKEARKAESETGEMPSTKKKKSSYGFSNFSAW